MHDVPATTSPGFADAISVITTLRDAGHIAYLAGGCVRDRLLGIEPKDYDVATAAPPAKVQTLFRRTQAVGAAFGVILVQVGTTKIEVATFRADGEYLDGRRPESVRFTSAEEDAKRRDFTINGLFFDPFAGTGAGQVIDFVGGQADLAAKLVRAIGDAETRFSEDHLRMLRAVRFAARFGLTIEPKTAAAIKIDAPKIRAIAAERVADELRRMLTAPSRSAAVDIMLKLGLANAILFPLLMRDGEHKHPLHGQDGASEPKLLTQALSNHALGFGVPLLALLIDVRHRHGGAQHDRLSNFASAERKKLVAFARERLKLSNDELIEMNDAAGSIHTLLTTQQPGKAMLKRFLADPVSSAARELMRAIASVGDAAARIAQLEENLRSFDGIEVAPKPLLTGGMLIGAGQQPGRAFKGVLDAVYDAQLEDRITSSAEALALGLSLLKKSH